ncbi:MAG: hypothetical protein NTZ30_17830 [Planctomycetota bacterium]|nr:hypothetical protein [Planctomycetota bacterium]
MTSIPIQSRLQLGFMKIAFVITLILTIFSSLSVWVILNGVFTKEFKETSEKFQEVLVEPTKTNTALKKEIPEIKADIVANIDSFDNLKMDEIDSQFNDAKRKRKDKDIAEKVVSIEEKELEQNPVFKLSELTPLLAFKNVKSILEKQINKDFSQDKLKGSPLTLNDGLIDFVNKRKEEISKSEKYKLEFGKRWAGEIKIQLEKDQKHVFEQLGITDVKKNDINIDGLKNLLFETDVNKYNSYFAFVYFKKPDLDTKIKSQQNWPGMNPLSEDDKKKPDIKAQRVMDIEKKKIEYLGYLLKYEEFLKKLNSDNKNIDNK